MAKFHINKHGVPAPCKAKEGNCPLGGEGTHFDSREEAQAYADKTNEQTHDLLPGVDSEVQSELSKRNYDYALSRPETMESDMLKQNTEDIGGYVQAIEEVKGMKVGNESIANSLAGSSLEIRDENEAIESAIQKEVLKDLGLTGSESMVDKAVSLNKELKEAESENESSHGIGETCPKCGEGKLVKRSGKYGDFVACDNFPKCKSTSKFSESKEEKEIKSQIKKTETELRNAEMIKANRLFNKIKENEAHQENKKKLEELDKWRSLAHYVDRNTKDNSKTPVESYYEKRKENDSKIKEKIGDNKVVFTDGGLTGGVEEVGENLTVDKDGKINNLYIEKDDSGEVQRVVGFGSSGLTLEDGTEETFDLITNWNMRSSRNASLPQRNRVYETKPNGEKFEGTNLISVRSYDSSD